ncbi:MAG: hypothetical protein ABUL60_03980, partial [Myxococcales bacterium]
MRCSSLRGWCGLVARSALFASALTIACSAPNSGGEPQGAASGGSAGQGGGGPSATSGAPQSAGGNGGATGGGAISSAGALSGNGGKADASNGGSSLAGASSGGVSGGSGSAGIGGNGGNGGASGASASATCSMVKSEYAAELEKQLACNPSAGSQCTNHVPAAPGCECRVFMQPSDPFAIEHLSNVANGWFEADCSMPGCPAKCSTAATGTCQADAKS